MHEERRCRCLSNDPTCWPNTSIWQNFNQSIDQRLVLAHPSAAVCNSNPTNISACETARVQWSNTTWRGNQPGAMQSHNWENSSCSVFYNSTTCNQGSVPIFAVNATLPEHVQATIRFVKKHNLRLAIKTTGHDYLGRSTAFGSLLLWLHHMKNLTLMRNLSLCTGEIVPNAIRLGAGVQWGDVYSWLAPYRLSAIGGAAYTVGATGGFLQGGGHGPLTRWKGLAADQVLEFDVVMADGRRQTANACQNADLFWALRGGGAGTFAVVLSAVLRAYETPVLISSFQYITAPNESRYNDFIHTFVRFLPRLADGGWTSYFYFIGKDFMMISILPNGDLNQANTTINQLTANYTDFNIIASISIVSMNDSPDENTEPPRETTENVLLGSRLIPESIVRNRPNEVADAFIQLNGHNKSVLIGHLVAGGQVSNTTQNNSVNPAWRTALLHMVFVRTWSDQTSQQEQQQIARQLTKQIEILQNISGGSQSGVYMNEADPNEPHWQQKFFGTMDNYNRLKSIKNSVDPDGIFICKNCVGSDDWSDDLNCPNKSSGKKILSLINLLLFIFLSY